MTTYERTTNPRLIVASEDTYLIDLFYENEPRTVGAFLLLDEHPALIETGPVTTLEHLLAGLRQAGFEPADLHYVFLTHIHLDHAGALGSLVERYGHLKVFVHPLGAPHLSDPSRLVGSARKVFGALLDSRFGEPRPVPVGNIHTLEDAEEVSLGRRRLKAVHTPGHAAHHFAFWEAERRWIYGGDVAGCALPDGPYVHPPTPSPEVDVAAWRASIARMRALQPARLLYTHFGWTDVPQEALEALEKELERRVALIKACLDEGLSDEAIVARFSDEVDDGLSAQVGPVLARRYLLLGDAGINAPGLIRYWRKRAAAPPKA